MDTMAGIVARKRKAKSSHDVETGYKSIVEGEGRAFRK